MKFGFVTCVQLGLSCIEAIYDIGGELDLIITLNDCQAKNKSGRVYLDEFCRTHGVPLLKSSHINNDECIKMIQDHGIDWLFIIGWSQIANKAVLTAPAKGVLGIHPTLLPQGRGRAAIPWAILKKLKQTGVTLIKLDEGVDTGDIAEQLVIPLDNTINATQLYELANNAHVQLIQRAFPRLEDDSIEFTAQDHSKATQWPVRKPTDGEIDLQGCIYDAERLVRAVTRPYPGAFTTLGGQKYVVWEAMVLSTHKPTDIGINFGNGFLKFIDYNIVD